MADGKIKRKFMAHFVNSAAPGTASPVYVRLGKDLEKYEVALNASINSKENINGETSVLLDSYKPQASIDPFYAEIGDPLFDRLQKIIDERQTLDDLKTQTVEVHLWDDEVSGKYAAYREDAIIEISSYGGDTTGYQIPFNIHTTGNRVKGTFDLTTKTFTAEGPTSPRGAQA